MSPTVPAAIAKARAFFLLGGLAWLAGLVPPAADRALIAALVVIAVAVEITLDGHHLRPAKTSTRRYDTAA